MYNFIICEYGLIAYYNTVRQNSIFFLFVLFFYVTLRTSLQHYINSVINAVFRFLDKRSIAFFYVMKEEWV
ncbi:hypothetical protein GCM10007140_24480 [Priestia taiwanensis]|uniref:Uncharacterized protein n=1 Tax=Priestia taiwanensis TaxID=1347902 RepID=A0A917ER04_9BACI|nr:hypothetical protein GCM10007140_24480 [Priestia taiwanensis]